MERPPEGRRPGGKEPSSIGVPSSSGSPTCAHILLRLLRSRANVLLTWLNDQAWWYNQAQIMEPTELHISEWLWPEDREWAAAESEAIWEGARAALLLAGAETGAATGDRAAGTPELLPTPELDGTPTRHVLQAAALELLNRMAWIAPDMGTWLPAPHFLLPFGPFAPRPRRQPLSRGTGNGVLAALPLSLERWELQPSSLRRALWVSPSGRRPSFQDAHSTSYLGEP